ncbi:MAG: trypsin-like serine protease [Myxococcota bacterium]
MRRVAFLCLLTACVSAPSDPIASSESSIINGSRETGFPEVVAVIRVTGGGGLCTGTVIGPRTVLSAKHCVFDGTTAISASSFRILVTDRIDRGSEFRVSQIFTTPGPFTDDDLTGGRDIALLNTTTNLPVTPREVSRSTARRGMPVEIVGFGRTSPSSSASGVKFSGTTNVGDIFVNVFQTMGMSRTCQGDSGGPAFDAVGRVLGVTSFGVDERCREDMSFYTEVQPHLALIEEALGTEPPCTDFSNRCNLADDDCDGVVDSGCGAIGDTCFNPEECSSGECRAVDGELVCVQTCNPEIANTGECPDSMVCEYLTCGNGQCATGRPGAGVAGSPCSQNSDCVDFYCYPKDDGTNVCGRPCSPEGPACEEGQICLTEGFACGACVPDPVAPQPLGAACTEASGCVSNECHPDGFCTTSCSGHSDCPGLRCLEGRCERGTPAAEGSPCTLDDECVDTAACGPEGLCARSCDAGCNADETCEDDFCVPDGLRLGETCAVNEECASRICAGTCTVLCTDTGVCPTGFECLPAGTESGCFPMGDTMDGGGGGCAAAGGASGAFAALVLLVGFRRRRD